MHDLTRHLSHYLVLFGLLLAGFAGLILFSYDRKFQIAVSLALSASYVSWGLVHHHLHHDLHIETFFEYLAIAALGFVIIFSMIVRT